MAVVDRVADGLTHKMCAKRPHAEALRVKQAPQRFPVPRVDDGLVDLEVVTPAGELKTLVPPGRDLRPEHLKRQIGPLAGEQRDGTSQPDLLDDRCGRRC